MISVLGSTGQVGSAFAGLLPDARFLTRSDLDLSRADVDTIEKRLSGSEFVINCAAYTGVDAAETELASAMAVNGTAVGRLAEATARMDVPFVTYSSDYVFDGQASSPYLETHPPDPINAYGRSKLAGEVLALAANPRSLVIRTSWVLSATHPNFVTAILKRVIQGTAVKVVNDQTGCPTVAIDLAAATLQAIGAGLRGVLHLTNQGQTTWFELARRSVAVAGLDENLVSPCTTAEYPTPARRPTYSVLGSVVADVADLLGLPTWEASLESVVRGSLSLLRG
ncbi:MAG: dTDP-4-dehydrorhamnose reductase [Acidimicrobiia bacterium]